ncbi:helix-turn-helix domain-containing protein [Peptoniphilus sp. AGMB00490]|uniref:Helix-turn-helix domain-containing protein n=1 Tax=Peptoniphilus faecalis TaxID=2731255 RepID=A0A848RK44_9FIRM|nr:helix-turn-helix domain-containing protein [Peptoniphilus faecalis]NMW84702.1 helix-turn-helix domain-containing protein [Peptoniphilus faecalis]
MINNKKVYKVVDYLTPAEVCKAIGISEKSTPLITRWINNGKIRGHKRFGRNKAIPVNWVKSECQSRGIDWQGVELEDNEIGVSLDGYIDLKAYASNSNKTYDQLYKDIVNGKIKNYIRFGNAFGLPKE